MRGLLAFALLSTACAASRVYAPIHSEPLEAAAAPAAPADKPRLVVPSGHAGAAWMVAFVAGGKRVVTLGYDNLVKVWDVASGRELYSRQVPYLVGGALLGDSRLAVMEGGSRVLVLTLDGLQPLRALRVEASANAIAATPDGKLVVGLSHGGVRLVDVDEGRELRSYEGLDWVGQVAVSPDGALIAAHGPRGAARIYDLGTGERVASFDTGEGLASASQFTPDGAQLVTLSSQEARAGAANEARVFDVRTGRLVRSLGRHAPGADQMALSPDGAKLALSDADGSVRVYDFAGDSLLQTLRGQRDRIHALAFSSDGRRLLSGSADRSVRLWDAEGGTALQVFTGQVRPLRALAATRDGNTLLLGGDGVHVWDARRGRELRALATGVEVRSLALSADERRVAIGGGDGTIRICALADGRELRSIKAHDGSVHFVGFTPEQQIVSAGGDGARVWNADTGERVRAFAGDGGWSRAALSPDGQLLALGTSATSRRTPPEVWSVATGERVRVLQTLTDAATPWEVFDTEGLAFSPDGRSLAWMADAFLDAADLASGATRFCDRPVGSHWMAFAPGGDALVVMQRDGHFHRVAFPSLSAGPDQRAAADDVVALQLLAGGSRALLGLENGGAAIVDLRDGSEIATLWPLASGWVVTTQAGYFDGAPEALQQMSWVRGEESYPLEAFSEGYFTPGLLPQRLSGQPIAAQQPKLSDGFAAPPEVRITAPARDAEIDGDSVEVVVDAVDRGGGIDDIVLYQDGKVVGGGLRGVRLAGRRNFHVALSGGQNRLRAVAFSSARIEGPADEITVVRKAGPRRPVLHLVLAGINQYKNPALNLNFATPDARAMGTFFAQASPLFQSVEERALFDADATKENILGTLARLRATPPEDVVVIYLAGHGESAGVSWYFVPYELTYPEREDELTRKGISSSELRDLLAAIGARKVLLLMDACKSGSALLAFRGFEERKALAQLARATGVHVVAASGSQQFASEIKELGHGAFTWTLLQGLSGAADGSPKDGVVTVRELLSYVENQLPEVSLKYRSEAQYPVVDSRGMDFPLAAQK